jgi:hypothetical protein
MESPVCRGSHSFATIPDMIAGASPYFFQVF